MKIQCQRDTFAHRIANDRYSLPVMWADYQDWHGGTPDEAHSSVQHWGNVEEYLADRHGLRTGPRPGQNVQEYLDHYFTHPASLAAAKLHSLAQSRPQVDGREGTDDYMLTDDDLTQGAALGLLKLRRHQQTKKLEPFGPCVVCDEEATEEYDGDPLCADCFNEGSQ